jgi:hypothetical protein
MYARKDIPTVLPDAVLRCRKLQTAAKVELDEMEKANVRRLNNLKWQQQSFQRTLTERHKRWRMHDRAFRLKLKRELGTDLATALRLRTIHDEEQKYLFEQKLVNQKKDDEIKAIATDKNLSKSVSIQPSKSLSIKEPNPTKSQFAIHARRVQSAATPVSRATPVVTNPAKLSARRPRTSRFDAHTERDTDAFMGLKDDFGSVLLRILSNIAATPDLDDDFTIRKRALEARERRLILTKDDRYFNLIKQLVPRKLPNENDDDDDLLIE